MTEPRCISPVQNILGEGPVWSARENCLYWLDIKMQKLFRLDPLSGTVDQIELPSVVGCVAPRAGGGLLAVSTSGIGIFDPESGAFDIRLPLEPDRPQNRPNDGNMGRDGCFWFGTMDDTQSRRSGAVYRLKSDWTCDRMLDDFGIPNTMMTDPSGTFLYAADSADGVIRAHPILSAGLGAGRDLIIVDKTLGAPDGSAVDCDGYIWNAQWGASRLVRYSSTGNIDRIVPMPVPQPSSCTFGGRDLKTLYITSARVGLTADELLQAPLSGALFALDCDVPGLQLPEFQG